MAETRVIVVGNEKGGAGKSTIAVHLVTALLYGGAKVAGPRSGPAPAHVGPVLREPPRLDWPPRSWTCPCRCR
jgi:hypothetical protein